MVEFMGYLSHAEGVQLILDADLLFLPLHKLPPGRRSTIVPGKTYEYVASGRPILAAVPHGDARDILAEAGTADVCAPSDVSRMTEILDRRVDAFLAGEPSPALAPGVAERYEYGRLARDLEGFFERVIVGARGGSTDA